ncbi:MAG: TetR/AcrR family transcriptional regulator [Syntrophomonas sp.]
MKILSHSGSTKERIIKATLDIMADEGFQNVTVRKISTRADVNIAAVNYHFGSKDMVIDKALKYVTSQMKKVFTILKENGQPASVRLSNFIQAYADTVYKYPDIVRYMIDQKIHHSNTPVEYSEYLEQEGIHLVHRTLQELHPDEEESRIYMRTLQILGCISFPILMGTTVQHFSGLNLNEKSSRNILIELLTEQMIK